MLTCTLWFIYVFIYWHFGTPGFDLMARVLQKQKIIITFHILDFNLKGSYPIAFHILHVNGYGWVDRWDARWTQSDYFDYLMLPQGPQIAKIVYYLTLWVIYEKLVVHCFPLLFIYLLCDEVFTPWYLIPTNGHPKHECYVLHVYLYLYKTRIDGTLNCKLVYMVTAVTYKLRGTMIPCGGGGSHQHHKCDTIPSKGETRGMSAW